MKTKIFICYLLTIIGTNFIVNWKWKEVKDDAIYHNFIR